MARIVFNLDRLLRRLASSIRERLSIPGSPVRYPIQWDSERQRRAFFATDGFGSGIPYRRTGAATNWKTGPIPGGWRVENLTGYVGHVIGGSGGVAEQSSIHQGRWTVARDVVDDVLRDVPDQVVVEIRRAVEEAL